MVNGRCNAHVTLLTALALRRQTGRDPLWASCHYQKCESCVCIAFCLNKLSTHDYVFIHTHCEKLVKWVGSGNSFSPAWWLDTSSATVTRWQLQSDMLQWCSINLDWYGMHLATVSLSYLIDSYICQKNMCMNILYRCYIWSWLAIVDAISCTHDHLFVEWGGLFSVMLFMWIGVEFYFLFGRKRNTWKRCLRKYLCGTCAAIVHAS